MTDSTERTVRERAQAIARLAARLPELAYDDRGSVLYGIRRHLDVLDTEHELGGPF